MNPRANRFAVVGRSLPGVDSRAKLTGEASYPNLSSLGVDLAIFRGGA